MIIWFSDHNCMTKLFKNQAIQKEISNTYMYMKVFLKLVIKCSECRTYGHGIQMDKVICRGCYAPSNASFLLPLYGWINQLSIKGNQTNIYPITTKTIFHTQTIIWYGNEDHDMMALLGGDVRGYCRIMQKNKSSGACWAFEKQTLTMPLLKFS